MALIVQLCSPIISYAVTSNIPFIQTHISVVADGSVPFDATTFAMPTSNAGTDASSVNGVVRITDLVRYKVEVAVNESASNSDLIATVRLDPTNTISQARQNWRAIPGDCIAGNISVDKQTLSCNLGKYREGSNVVFYAEAIVTQRNKNGDTVQASVSAKTIDGLSNTAIDGPTSVMTTAGFGVDLVSTLKPPFKNTSGDIIYVPDVDVTLTGGVGGTGYMVTYRVSADYRPGSAFVSGDINNKVSYVLSDTFQYFSGNLSTGALFAGCSDASNNIGSIVCPAIGTNVFDTSASKTFPININNIDIASPVDDNKIFLIDVKYWIPLTDIRTDGTPLTNRNDVYFSGGSIVGANNQPVSTDNIANPNENIANNGMDYPLFRWNSGGGCSIRASFWGQYSDFPKAGKKKVFPGEIVDQQISLVAYSPVPGKKYSYCTNIDTSQIELYSINDIGYAVRGYHYYGLLQGITAGTRNSITSIDTSIPSSRYTIEYSDAALDTNAPASSALRDSDCRDDIDGNGSYDWKSSVGQISGGTGNITKMRVVLDYKYDLDVPVSFLQISGLLKYKVKNTAQGGDQIGSFAVGICYGADNNNWNMFSSASTDPLDPNYSLDGSTADRLNIVGAKAGISKSVSTPSGTSIVKGGDNLTYIISPSINGGYIPANGTVPITITDTLPNNTSLVSWTGINCGSSTVSLTTASSANPLIWSITGSVGQPLCQIQYVARVSNTAGVGDYINTARIDICDPTIADDCNILDKESDALGDDTIPILAIAGVSIVSQGIIFDVKKDVPEETKQLNTPFVFNVSYANLGIENFSDAKIIDVLPYNGDSSMTGSSGPNTSRSPGSNFSGTYQLTNISASNGEYGFEVTDADPALIALDASMSNTSVAWTSCTNLTSPSTCLANITAVRRNVPATSLSAGALRKTLALTLTPSANHSGDIYTNSFSAKVPEMNFPVVSNDISVQIVAGSIGDTVWIDDNSDGIVDTGEALLANIPVILYSSIGTIITSGVTNLSGQYLFVDLPSGEYRVSITPPEGLTPSYDFDSGTGNLSGLDNTTLVTLITNANLATNQLESITSNLDADFGLYSTLGSVAGHIYLDSDANSGYNGSDIYVSNIQVQLFSGVVVIATGVTDASGYYYIPSIIPGVYDLSYEIPLGYNSYTSIGGQGSIGTGLGNLNGGALSTHINGIILGDKQNSIDNNFGLVTPYDLAITKISDIGSGTSDDLVTYTIIYGNVGGRPVDNVVVQDIWPDNYLNFVSSSPNVTTQTSPTLFSWNVGGLGLNQTGSIVITARIRSGLVSGTVIDNIATIYTSDDSTVIIDPITGVVSGSNEAGYINNTSSATQTTADTDLSIIKTVDKTFVIKGDTVNWIVDYHNAGPQTANDVVIYDLLPSGIEYVSSTLNGANTLANSNIQVTGGSYLSWNIGQLLANTSGQIVITTIATNLLLENTPIYNTVVISGSTTERLLTNNTSIVQTIAATATGLFDGYVWYDSDNSSNTGNQYGYAESAASGAIIEIYNTSGVLITTLITDSAGHYDGILPIGDYYTTIMIPTYYDLTTVNNTAFTIVRDTSQHIDDDGLYHKPGSFSAHVWYDDDRSQTQNNLEQVTIGVVVVDVYDSSNMLMATYMTDIGGNITGSLIPGDYTMEVRGISGYEFTTQQMLLFTILSETNEHIYDFGIVKRISPAPSGSSSSRSAPSSIVSSVLESIVNQSVVVPELVTTPLKQSSDIKLIKKLALDHDIVITQVDTTIDLSPRVFIIPLKLLDTGTPESELKAKGIAVKHNIKVDTQMPEWIQPVSASTAATMTLDDWIARIPQDIQNKLDINGIMQWIIIPSLGVVVPIDSIPEDNVDWTELVNGGEIGINNYLKKGVVHYPLSKNPGEIGNMIIAGHSSYYTKDDGLFKTIFASIPLLNAGDEVIVYQAQGAKEIKKQQSWDTINSSNFSNFSKFSKFSYIIHNSYEITPYDTWILNSRPTTSHLTLFTCTPIGSNKNRWYIDATLQN